jgi:hypothetical protein
MQTIASLLTLVSAKATGWTWRRRASTWDDDAPVSANQLMTHDGDGELVSRLARGSEA